MCISISSPWRPAKVIGASREGWLDQARAIWALVHNEVMAGTAPSIDHRSLVDQGKPDRLPTLHEGAGSRAVSDKGKKPRSQSSKDEGGREVNWPEIDRGTTRAEINEMVKSVNSLREQLGEDSDARRPDGISAPTRSGYERGEPTNSRGGGPHRDSRIEDAGRPGAHDHSPRDVRDSHSDASQSARPAASPVVVSDATDALAVLLPIPISIVAVGAVVVGLLQAHIHRPISDVLRLIFGA